MSNPIDSSLSMPSGHARASALPSGLWWGLWLVFLVAGAVGVYQRFTQGHLPAGYGSYVPWGLWVALYFHGVGIAGGAFLLGAGGYVLDLPGFRSRQLLRMTIVLAAAAIAPAFMGVWFDLGHMERSHRIFTSPSFTSMMAFNAWMYGAFMLIAIGCFFLSLRREPGDWLKPLLCLGILLCMLFPSQSGAFFGVVDAKPYWHSALLPMMFLTSAVTAGGGLLLTVRALLRRDDGPESDAEHAAAQLKLRYVVLTGLIAYLAFEFAELSIAFWNPTTHAPEVELMLFGPYWWVFWIVHLLFGGLIPLALLLRGARSGWVVAAALIAVTFVSARLNVLVPGQAVGEIKGLQEAFNHDRLRYIYHATPMEYLVGLFMLATGMAVFWVGQRVNRRLSSNVEAAS